MAWILTIWRRLAIDPATGQVSSAFMLTAMPLILTALVAMIRPLRQPAVGKLSSWYRAVAGRPRREAGTWEVPNVETLKRQCRVLIIDDENFAHFEQLPLRDFKVTHWKSVDRNAVSSLDKNFDVVVLDVKGVQDSFGAKDGIEALDLLRRDNPWIPIVVNTAYLGDLSESRKKLIKDYAQKSIAKLIRYAEFEESIVELLQTGRTFAYFELILERLAVAEPATILKMAEAAQAVPHWSFVVGTKPAPFQKDQVDSVLKLAHSIHSGERWSKRT